jgi:hypothetical protein
MDSGIVDVKFKGQAFARNSICFGGILFNVSSFSFSLPSNTLLVRSRFQYCFIPRQATGLIPCVDGERFFQFIGFEFQSQLARIDYEAFCRFPKLLSVCIPRSVETTGLA